MAKIVLDAHEIMVLIESCWKRRTFLRQMILDKIIDFIYPQLSEVEIIHIHTFLSSNKVDKERLEENEERFLARFNPKTQFNITYIKKDKTKAQIKAYWFLNKYWTGTKTFIPKQHIKRIQTLN